MTESAGSEESSLQRREERWKGKKRGAAELEPMMLGEKEGEGEWREGGREMARVEGEGRLDGKRKEELGEGKGSTGKDGSSALRDGEGCKRRRKGSTCGGRGQLGKEREEELGEGKGSARKEERLR